MTKRKLTKEEEKHTRLGLGYAEKKIDKLLKKSSFICKTISHQQACWDYEDSVKEYKRQEIIDRNNKEEEVVQAEIADENKNITTLKEHLKYGVEIKNKVEEEK